MAATQVESYEEVRRRKLEENKRKLEELKLGHLSVALREASTPKTSSPAKQVKRKPAQEEYTIVKRRSDRLANLPEPTYVKRRSDRLANLPEPTYVERRSDRLANLPEPTYKEVIPEVVHRPRKISKHSVRISKHSVRISKHRDLSNRVYASHRARAYTIKKAGELEDGLGAAYPSFVKPMLQSHTTGGFWLGLPTKFCNMHLPEHDSTIYLVDEDGEESPTTYLAYKKGLSAGWRGFSITHELVDGDALVFQLIKATTFKVYIIRASSYANFLSVKKQKKQEDQVKKKKKNGKTKRVLTLCVTSDRELPLLCSV